jgi:hypothetical protein
MYRADDNTVDDTVGMLLNIDATTFDLLTENQALLGDPAAIARVQRLANGRGPAASDPTAVAHAKVSCPNAHQWAPLPLWTVTRCQLRWQLRRPNRAIHEGMGSTAYDGQVAAAHALYRAFRRFTSKTRRYLRPA